MRYQDLELKVRYRRGEHCSPANAGIVTEITEKPLPICHPEERSDEGSLTGVPESGIK